MAENIYEKLGRIENKVDAILPPRDTVDAMIEEALKNKDPKFFDFIKSADRVFYYVGDRSELRRKNRKTKQRSIVSAVAATILMTIQSVFSFFIEPFAGIAAIVLELLLCVPFIVIALNESRWEDKIIYQKWFSKLYKYDYDDNGIVCAQTEKWYIKLHQILSVSYLYIGALSFLFLGMFDFLSGAGVILLLVGAVVLQMMIMNKEIYPYKLMFEKDGIKIPYDALKKFMSENGLK